MNSIKELMTLYGYRFHSTCNCNGTKTMKYRKGEYEFRWRVNQYKFRVSKDGMVIKSWTSAKEAEGYLQELHGVNELV